MKTQFTHYLHDDSDSWYEAVSSSLPRDMSADEAVQVLERVKRPFYEVAFDLELDTETGEVTILRSTL